MRANASAWSPPLTLHSQSAYFVQLYVWICLVFWKTSSASHCFCFKPTTQCTFTERIICSIVSLNVSNVLKNFFCESLLLLQPTTQCTFTERIICSIVCLNVYNVLENFLCELMLLLEAHHSLYIHRAHILFNCMFEYV